MKYLAFLLLTLTCSATSAPSIGEISLKAPSGVPVPWSRDKDRYTLYVGCGLLDFRNERKELRSGDETYFYAWFWHYQWSEFAFEILEKIPGTPPEVVFLDLNHNGTEEVILKNVDGAHTRKWYIYQRVGTTRELKKLGVISSDWGKIFVTEREIGGYSVIEAWDRNYDDQRLVIRKSYSFRDGLYCEEPTQPPEPIPPGDQEGVRF